MPSDTELAAKLVRGEQAALAELYDRLGGRAYGLAYSILGDSSEAEEAVSDGFLQLWRQSEEYSEKRGSLETMLLMIVRSRALDRLRARTRRARLAEGADHDVAANTTGGPGRDPEEAGLARVVVEGPVSDALGVLEVGQRRVIELAYLGGMTHSEIAEELGVPLGTVKTRLRNGMMSLRATLGVS